MGSRPQSTTNVMAHCGQIRLIRPYFVAFADRRRQVGFSKPEIEESAGAHAPAFFVSGGGRGGSAGAGAHHQDDRACDREVDRQHGEARAIGAGRVPGDAE